MLDKARESKALILEQDRLRKELRPFLEPQRLADSPPWTENELKYRDHLGESLQEVEFKLKLLDLE